MNNASSEKTIEFAGRSWTKTADSLPQKAHGLRYGLGVSREINAGGHHFLYGGISRGVHYWDNKDFSEQSLRLSFGHQNRSVTRSFGTVPFVGQNLLGGSRYNFVGGFNADFSRRLGERWRLTLNAGNMWKHYQEDRTAARYGSHMPLAGATLMYSAPKDRLLYGGADWPHDMTKEAEQASVRKGLRVGAVKTFDGGLGLRANLRYTRRTFDAPGTIVYRFPRKDHEYQANLSLRHDKISWKGFTPQLNFRYLKIDSNMKSFYTRKNTQIFMSVEKDFK
ncbi:TPA: surface lipoprotein assembly modifier [Neisseria gonorrhoeae]|uniref:surface lipoprotein assembly modifier n=1 Tax=Neisseria gonorrhoeae TaxID=485 RepID=UPI0021E0FB56|nr:surface lipoprotein assembly modifier [Neisseria gonorrhoeae]MCU9823437.1 surface lipoprotein assembly modifier [Neisseria gonorrhoeae]MCU9829145.1 surface lipoprotein assembly modifier [Neisseria gonorrhoeae]MCU9835281.1 surface lipoprotein assembly modifier [Neisseria gonorrhoeae]MCU9859269.1 surface lipoprotein assembly modifier [Neisseria gonorrhoeae]